MRQTWHAFIIILNEETDITKKLLPLLFYCYTLILLLIKSIGENFPFVKKDIEVHK